MASVAQEARRARFHRDGPWVLAGTAILAVIIYEAIRHHALNGADALFFAILVPTVVLHEISHGVVAYWCGDDTAKQAGRLTLNPFKHIDPIGSILLPILLIATTGRAFGWAKPVPVNIGQLRHPRNQAVLVGLAGPAVNVVIALATGFLFRALTADPLLALTGNVPMGGGSEFLFFLATVNVFIAVFNLIPIPPLDGSAVIERLLPTSMLMGYYRLRSFSLVIVLFLVLVDQNLLDRLFNNAENIFWLHIIV